MTRRRTVRPTNKRGADRGISGGSSLPIIEMWAARCEQVLVGAAVLATFGMMCLTSADALSRYLFNSPILGAYEITEKYLMVAAIFLGLSYAFRGGVFIRVTFLVDRLPPFARQIANHAAHLISIGFCVILLVATAQQAIRSISDETQLSALPIPVGPAYWLVPIGFLALTVAMVWDLQRVRGGTSRLFKEEAPSA
jgi:TRAP-type C4-dicarboxylate transport system permease small subunit